MSKQIYRLKGEGAAWKRVRDYIKEHVIKKLSRKQTPVERLLVMLKFARSKHYPHQGDREIARRLKNA